MNLTVHNVYFCFSEVGCTISLRDGTPCKEVPAHTPTLFVAQQPDMVCSDPAAVVKEIPNGLQLLHGQMMKEQAAVSLPAGYKRVEYLEYAGGRTGFSFEGVMGVGFIQESEFMLTADHKGRILFMNGTYDEWWAFGQVGQNKVSASTGAGIYCSINKKYKIVYTFDENRVQTIECDGKTSIYSKDNGNYPTGNEKRFADFPTLDNNQFFARLYSLRMTCARHGVNMKLIPCLDDVGAPCLFDTVNHETYYNKGTNDFLYPTETTTYALRRVLPDWGKLTPHGLRRLYHAPAGYTGELYDYALENGFKPIIEAAAPEEGYWSPRWTETEDEIVLEWVETEPLMDEPLTNN